MLRSKFLTAEQVEAVIKDVRTAGLPQIDVAIMLLAHKITQHAYEVTWQDIEELRSHGLSDGEILDVVAAAAARNFFSKLLDAIGAEPDAAYTQLEAPLRAALTVGRALPP